MVTTVNETSLRDRFLFQLSVFLFALAMLALLNSVSANGTDSIGTPVKAGGAESLLRFDQPEFRQRYYQLIDELRCPKCQNQNLADSNAPIANDLREQLQTLLNEGKTDQQILDFMTARYGTFVLYEPPRNNYTMILWLLPALGFVIGAVVIINLIRKPASVDDTNASGENTNGDSPAVETAASSERQALDRKLAALRERANS